MFDLVQTILATLVTLGILVTIHEWGHFWVARRCGVKVLRFSVGFGKPLFMWRDKQDTEYAIAAIPLGGYVRMLDEREGEVPEHMRQQAFNNKPLSQRMAVVAAGPVVNLIFAVFAYWLMFVVGVSSVKPVIGELVPQSPAEQAGLSSGYQVMAVNGQQTASWEDVNLQLARWIGEDARLVIDLQHLERSERRSVQVPLQQWQVDIEHQSPLNAFGIIPWRPMLAPVIGQIVAGGAAQQAGLQMGDRVVAINDQPVERWSQLVEQVQRSAGKPLVLLVERQGGRQALEVIPASRKLPQGGVVGYIGAGVEPAAWPESMQHEKRLGVFEAIPAAFERTGQMISLTLDSIWKMIEGVISVKNLSGPITIAKVAGASAASGFEAFIGFLAYLSISLGVLNLLPIPMLDGGHLLYYLIEGVRGKPVSENIQVLGLKIGMAILFSLMAVAIFNDVARL